MLKRLQQALQHDQLFSISLLLAVGSSFLSLPRIEYIDWQVIFCLLNLSAILLALEELRVLDRVSIQILSVYKCQRTLSLILVSLTFVSAMFITNDMALLTLVPLTLIIARKTGFDPGFTIILQALAANIGSSLTPVGNPQNLFLFSYYHLTLQQFLLIMIPFMILGAFWLWVLNHLTEKRTLIFKIDSFPMVGKSKIIIYLLLLAAVFLSVVRVIDYRLVTVMVFLILIFWDKHLLKRLDLCLPSTFICFFIIVGNLSQSNWLSNSLGQMCKSSSGSYIGSILLSQVMSNVPAAILISHFTLQWKAVLLGVNVGGLGTLIASMASVIAYRLYIREYSGHNYMGNFLFYNFISLAIFSITMYYLTITPYFLEL